jgi:hypothetical protein
VRRGSSGAMAIVPRLGACARVVDAHAFVEIVEGSLPERRRCSSVTHMSAQRTLAMKVTDRAVGRRAHRAGDRQGLGARWGALASWVVGCGVCEGGSEFARWRG